MKKQMQIICSAPTRIDLAGGTLDLWPIYNLLEVKATVNAGITLNAQTRLELHDSDQYQLRSDDQDISVTGTFEEVCKQPQLPLFALLLKAIWSQELPAFRLTTKALSPAGAGLGGSSCLGITIAKALFEARTALRKEAPISEQRLVQTVQDVESKLIHAPTGCQDYWGAVRGRVNIINYPYGSVDVQTLSKDHLTNLQDHCIICYSGQSRASAINNWEIFKRVFDKDKELLKQLEAIGEAAWQCAEATAANNTEQMLRHSANEWRLRKLLWPNIETEVTKKIDQATKQSGALFSRVCGAGGGGVMAIFCPPSKKDQIKLAAQNAGGIILDAAIAQTGLTVSVNF